MAIDKHQELVRTLHRMTSSGRIAWKKAATDDEFQASFSRNSIRISTASTERGQDYYISLINSIGDVADSFSDVDLDRGQISFDGSPEFFRLMGELYAMARRSAFGADKILDSILEQLREEDSF